MTKPLPTYEVFVGESLPDMRLFIRENGVLVSGLSSGHTFELKVAPLDSSMPLFIKTTGITGQTGSGLSPLGTPNVVIQWTASGELDQLEAGVTYRAQLHITRASDNRRRTEEWLIAARAAL